MLVIFDPDNLVHPDFLRILNTWYNKGYQAVQGKLQSKNKGSIYAQLDLGVLVGNFLERDVRSMLGLSVNIWGCGVSVKKEVYQKIIYDGKSRMGGFDKYMQTEIAKNQPPVHGKSDLVHTPPLLPPAPGPFQNKDQQKNPAENRTLQNNLYR